VFEFNIAAEVADSGRVVSEVLRSSSSKVMIKVICGRPLYWKDDLKQILFL
jgi:hypothetical protein